MSSINRDNGYMVIDHRGTDGLPEDILAMVGLPRGAGRGMFEVATIYCVHCGGHTIKNPERLRPRGFCKKCNHYICDPCEAAKLAPDYVHRTIEELTILVQGGDYEIVGSSSAPVLIPRSNNG